MKTIIFHIYFRRVLSDGAAFLFLTNNTHRIIIHNIFQHYHYGFSSLGRKFAVFQIKLAIVHLIQSYSISVNTKTIEPMVASPYDSLLAPISDVYLEFIPIQKNDE